MTDDAELLRRYAEDGDHEALGELVRRRIDFVHAAALRQTRGNLALAEDVTQMVFIDLARKAARLSRHAVLTGWLHTATRFAAAKAMRAESRRQTRERVALAMDEALRETAAPADWARLQPEIDAVLGELKERERAAILLRFFEGKALAEVGAKLALSETAARSCVDRALEKLRESLARRGVTSTSAALGAWLASEAGAASAPAGLAASVTGAALAGATSGGALGWAAIFTMSKIKTGIVGAVLLAGLATAVVEVRANRALAAEYRVLGGAGDELGRLRKEGQELTAALSQVAGGNAETSELARLHARIAQLKARPAGVVDAAMKPVTHAGRATPVDAYVTFAASLNAGDLDGVARLVTFRDDTKEGREAFMATLSENVRTKYRTPERVFAAGLFGIHEGRPWGDPSVSYQVMSQQEDLPGIFKVRLWVRQASGRESEMRDVFQNTPDGWAIVFRPLSDERTAAEVRARFDPATGDPWLPKKTPANRGQP